MRSKKREKLGRLIDGQLRRDKKKLEQGLVPKPFNLRMMMKRAGFSVNSMTNSKKNVLDDKFIQSKINQLEYLSEQCREQLGESLYNKQMTDANKIKFLEKTEQNVALLQGKPTTIGVNINYNMDVKEMLFNLGDKDFDKINDIVEYEIEDKRERRKDGEEE